MAKPFLKWAGGKTQLIRTISSLLPKVTGCKEFNYIEPFVGSGAMLFWMLNNYPNLKKAVINDINQDLIKTYRVIAEQPKKLISLLKDFEAEYHLLDNIEKDKKEYYYDKRKAYNSRENNDCEQASLFIFLNKTCFNGLYRVNKKNEFNVPIGSYRKPMICDSENILAVSKALEKVTILDGDFEQTINFAPPNSFFYFDPPYKPLNQTSSFNSYSKDEFNDNEQIRLKHFCFKLDELGHSWILSNSDVNGKEKKDSFFDDLYSNFIIRRVEARRSINANPNKRGLLKELIITN